MDSWCICKGKKPNWVIELVQRYRLSFVIKDGNPGIMFGRKNSKHRIFVPRGDYLIRIARNEYRVCSAEKYETTFSK